MKKILLLLIIISGALNSNAQNHALLFNGIEGHLTFDTNSDFNIGEGFTVEAWIFANAWKGEAWAGSIISKDKDNPQSGFTLRAGKNGSLNFVMGMQGWPEIQSQPIMNTRQWYHVAAVYDNGIGTLYINGSEVANGVMAGNPVHNTLNLNIGESSGFPGRIFDGAIDEIRVWNTVRTPTQIKDNQMTDFTGSESGLVTYFPFNEGTGLMTSNQVNGAANASFENGLNESSWTDGYSVPSRDVGVTRILSPDEVNMFDRPTRIEVELQNYGSETASNFPLRIIRNGIPTIMGNFIGSIQPGETAKFTFNDLVDFTNTNTNLITAETTDPEDKNSFNNSTSYRYQRPDEGNIINIFNEEQHNFASAGQSRFNTVILPADIEKYSRLLMHFSFECPNTGCDPWDQTAKLIVVDEDHEYEIARLITPYGIGCGPWTVDVTDFKSILSGAVKFKSFIQVWGTSGWLLNVEMELVEGDNSLPFQKLTPLWEEDYWTYGDPNVNDDLPARSITIESITKSTHQRMTITGHGQGNTGNAAEFLPRMHTFMLNGTSFQDHNLWKSDCGQNTCSGQAGNWTPSRAGWCPGQIVDPVMQNLSSVVSSGETITLDYELEDYTNLLNTGYDGAGHTEPHYRLWSYLIESSDERYVKYSNLVADKVSILSNGDTNNPVVEKITMTVTNNGSEVMSDPTFVYWVNNLEVVNDVAYVSISPGESYTHEFVGTIGFVAGEDHDVFGQVKANGDENLSDDAVYTFIDAGLTTSINDYDAKLLTIYPNPSGNGQVTIESPSILIGKTINILDGQGKLLNQVELTSERQFVNISNISGLYFVSILGNENDLYYQKVSVK